MTRSHLVIPDTQVKPGLKLDWLEWVGKFIGDRKPDVVVHLGDHWDMPSLSSYDKGKKCFEGRRYKNDINAGNEGFERLNWGITKTGGRRYTPRRLVLRGNHEFRILRAIDDAGVLDGTIGYHDLQSPGWEPYDFLVPVTVDGITYSHFFPRAASGAIIQTKRGSPSARAQVIREGRSCTAGHQQGLDATPVTIGGRLQWGMIAGSCYPHDELYLSPQGHCYWKGVIVKHQVTKGSYDPMFVSLGYLRSRYGSPRTQ